MDRLSIFQTLLAPLRPGRYLDLGTGHGKFALTADRLGWQVTAVDARTERMPNTPGIEWVRSDVRGYPTEGYDCIGILGLLYHLELPDQINLLVRAASAPIVIVDTHYSLNPKTQVMGYEGQWFDEELDQPTASWGNQRSYWPTKPGLISIFEDCGYQVWELQPPYQEALNFFFLRSQEP